MDDVLIAHTDSEKTPEESPLILRITEHLVSRDSEYFATLEEQLGKSKTHSLSTVGFVSGTLAGAFGVIVGHPLDTLKTRAQSLKSFPLSILPLWSTAAAAGPPPSSIAQLRALYRGILGPLVSAGIFQAINFGIYDNARNVLELGPFTAAALAGGVLSVLNTPVGLVKVQEQVLPVDKRSSTIGRLRQILRGPKPIRSLYVGFSVNSVSEALGRGVYMWVYDNVKRYFADPDDNDVNVSNLPMSKRIIAAAAAGTSSWFAIFPLDVIKSRMQCAPVLQGVHYNGVTDCVRQIVRAEGWRALFRGLSFTLLRAAPVASCVLPVYDVIHAKLSMWDQSRSKMW